MYRVHVPFLFPGSLPAVFLTDPLLFHFFPEAAFQGQVYTPMNTSRTQDGSCHPLFSRSPHPHLYSFLLLPMPVSQDKNEIMAYHRKQKTDLPSPSVSDKNKSPLMALHQGSDLVLPGDPRFFGPLTKKGADLTAPVLS